MAKPTATVHGVPEVQAAFRRMADAAQDLRAAHEIAGKDLARDIRSGTPVRTGRLARSWTVSAQKDRALVGTDVPYAGPVESGVPARGIPGAHMVAEAVAAAGPTIAEPYDAALSEAARRAGF